MSDPDREPGLARRYGVEQYGTIVLETKAKSEKVLDADEERLTNGLVKVTREGRRTSTSYRATASTTSAATTAPATATSRRPSSGRTTT